MTDDLRDAARAVLDSAMETFNGAVEVSEESLQALERSLVQRGEVEQLRDLVGSMWFYMRGRDEERLTTEQRELLYDVLDAEMPNDPPMRRWWRGPLDVEWPHS